MYGYYQAEESILIQVGHVWTLLQHYQGGCDDVAFYGGHFRMDCDYPSAIIHIWNTYGQFKITEDLSSINFVELERG